MLYGGGRFGELVIAVHCQGCSSLGRSRHQVAGCKNCRSVSSVSVSVSSDQQSPPPFCNTEFAPVTPDFVEYGRKSTRSKLKVLVHLCYFVYSANEK